VLAARPHGHGEHAVIAVSDRGGGIAADDLDRIFEPFFSRKEGGTGLGLATVARIVEDYRGTIEVASREGEGTLFTIRLPIGRAPGTGDLTPRS
jgi:signal transduction histidine kinase